MKRNVLIFLMFAAVLAAFSAGCTGKTEVKTHPGWDDAWFRIGDLMAVSPVSGFELNESNDVLSPAGLYYATWTKGEGRQITNAQGQEATVYDVQIYLLLKEDASENAVRADIADWMKRESGAYETGAEKTITVSGQDFTVLPLLSAGSDNPYVRGAAAFAEWGTNAVSVEILCGPDHSGDPEAILTDFLNCLHY